MASRIAWGLDSGIPGPTPSIRQSEFKPDAVVTIREPLWCVLGLARLRQAADYGPWTRVRLSGADGFRICRRSGSRNSGTALLRGLCGDLGAPSISAQETTRVTGAPISTTEARRTRSSEVLLLRVLRASVVGAFRLGGLGGDGAALSRGGGGTVRMDGMGTNGRRWSAGRSPHRTVRLSWPRSWRSTILRRWEFPFWKAGSFGRQS